MAGVVLEKKSPVTLGWGLTGLLTTNCVSGHTFIIWHPTPYLRWLHDTLTLTPCVVGEVYSTTTPIQYTHTNTPDCRQTYIYCIYDENKTCFHSYKEVMVDMSATVKLERKAWGESNHRGNVHLWVSDPCQQCMNNLIGQHTLRTSRNVFNYYENTVKY